jgi:hypothetical protein
MWLEVIAEGKANHGAHVHLGTNDRAPHGYTASPTRTSPSALPRPRRRATGDRVGKTRLRGGVRRRRKCNAATHHGQYWPDRRRN